MSLIRGAQERQKDEARLFAKVEAAVFNATGNTETPVTPEMAMGEPEIVPDDAGDDSDDRPNEGEVDAARWWAEMLGEVP